MLVVRQDYDGLRRYAHIGTGNYHAGTARLYTDFGLLTCDDGDRPRPHRAVQLPDDRLQAARASTTSCSSRRSMLKQALLEKIEREIAHARQRRAAAYIQWKMNALEDVDITRALYRASQARRARST